MIRVLEYEGPAEWVSKTLAYSTVAPDGVRMPAFYRGKRVGRGELIENIGGGSLREVLQCEAPYTVSVLHVENRWGLEGTTLHTSHEEAITALREAYEIPTPEEDEDEGVDDDGIGEWMSDRGHTYSIDECEVPWRMAAPTDG